MTGIAETVSDRKAMILAMALSKARARRQREHPDWPQDAISDEDYAKIIEEYERLTGLAESAATISELVAARDELTAEVERLRSALERIQGRDSYIDASVHGGRKVILGDFARIADEALNASKGDHHAG